MSIQFGRVPQMGMSQQLQTPRFSAQTVSKATEAADSKSRISFSAEPDSLKFKGNPGPAVGKQLNIKA